MKPIKFPEQNIVYAENQPEYLPLPAFKNDSAQGEVISCWQLDWKERLRILWSGKLWVSLMSFNKPLTPSFFSTKKADVLITPKTKSEKFLYKVVGKWRLLFGFCPQCNSDAPELYECPVCNYNKKPKSKWWSDYEFVNQL